MSCNLRFLFWRAVFICLLLSLCTRVARTGFSYWQDRYSSLGYSDWDGFWNTNGGGNYDRASSGSPCGGCACDGGQQKATCTGVSV